MGQIAHLRKILKCFQYDFNRFHYFLLLTLLYSSFEEIKKFESPSPKDALCQVWSKLALKCWRKKIEYFIFPLTPLGKGCGPSFEQTWIPITQGCFVSNFDEINSVLLEETIFECLQHNFQNSPREKTWPCIWTKSKHSTQGCFVLGLVEIRQVVQKKIIF